MTRRWRFFSCYYLSTCWNEGLLLLMPQSMMRHPWSHIFFGKLWINYWKLVALPAILTQITQTSLSPKPVSVKTSKQAKNCNLKFPIPKTKGQKNPINLELSSLYPEWFLPLLSKMFVWFLLFKISHLSCKNIQGWVSEWNRQKCTVISHVVTLWIVQSQSM